MNEIKLCAMNRTLLRAKLKSLGSRLDYKIVPDYSNGRDEIYYPQFQQAVRDEASQMALHYEIFYCLEKSIRSLVVEKLLAEVGPEWWDNAVPESVRINAKKNRQRELDSGMTSRSEQWIDYTTFGELGEIVRQNRDAFADMFSSTKAFDRVMNSLNLLRGPIAHCSPMAEDEIDRLHLTLRDWFRLMT